MPMGIQDKIFFNITDKRFHMIYEKKEIDRGQEQPNNTNASITDLSENLPTSSSRLEESD
jgi:hypothetical protein